MRPGGDDILEGSAGNDTLFGGKGVDELLGGEGDDVLEGGAGADRLSGGAGDDTFVQDFAQIGNNTITDFSPEEDTIDLQGLSEDVLATLTVTATEDGSGTYIDGGNGSTLTINGVIPAEFAGSYTIDGRSFSIGGDGDDYLSGDEGDDSLFGGGGNDELLGGDGADILTIAPNPCSQQRRITRSRPTICSLPVANRLWAFPLFEGNPPVEA